MEIEHIKDPALIATILRLDDPGPGSGDFANIKCSKAEWVQYLTEKSQEFDGECLRIYGVVNDNRVTGYMVAMNCFMPPLFRLFTIMYQAFSEVAMPERKEAALGSLDKIEEWALEYGCHVLTATVKDEETARLYAMHAGFKKTGEICLYKEF